MPVRTRRRTGLGQALHRYRGLVENAVEGIFQTTPEGRYLMANPMLARIYGYETPEELTSTLTDIAHQLYVDPERRTTFQRLLHEHGSVQGFESEVYRRDGQRIWISECARAVRAPDGRLMGYEGTVEDITRRKQAEAERALVFAALQDARAELEVRVRDRTSELAEANASLREEIVERRRAEAELAQAHRELAAAEEEKKRFYREVIRCVTRGKFHLVDPEAIPDPGEPGGDRPLEELRDEPLMRKALREFLTDAGMAKRDIEDLELAVGEAATNAVKHGTQGRCRFYRRGDDIVIRVSDQGTGIRAGDLPATLLLPGFSSAASLGMGYTLMLELVDRIWLATDREGTIVQLEKRLHPDSDDSLAKMAPLFAAWDRF